MRTLICLVAGVVFAGCATTPKRAQEVAPVVSPATTLSQVELEEFFEEEILKKLFRSKDREYEELKAEVVRAVYPLYDPSVGIREFLTKVLLDPNAQAVFNRQLAERYPNITTEERQRLIKEAGNQYSVLMNELSFVQVRSLRGKIPDLIGRYGPTSTTPVVHGED